MASRQWPTLDLAVSSEDEEETAAASAAGVPDRVVSSEDEEEATAAPAGDEDSACDHGLYGIAPGSLEAGFG